tara:strand:- start:1002 stop:1682 length:681 start_codon:yes stop_codon:yes gene_type:complete
MGRAKEIILKVIPSNRANDFVKKHHYSAKVVPNSQLHFGCFLDGKLGGVMSYGVSMDKRKMLSLVETQNKTEATKWNEFLELNRMAFSDILPKYAESRCISISIKLLKKNAPHIKWIVSYADATQCGDGTIYRASGFLLTSIKKNSTMLKMPNGQIIADKTLNNSNYKKIGQSAGYWKKKGAKPIKGFQLRYIYLIDKKSKLNVPVMPFSKIKEMGAGMYKGKMRV